MTKEEALRMALEALEVANSCVDGYYIPKGKTQLPEVEEAITAIRECLAKPEHDWKAEYIKQVELHNQTLDELRDALAQQEPVIDKSAAVRIATALGWEPKRKPLTDEELYKVFPAIATYHEANKTLYRSIARAIEATHEIWPENSDCYCPDWTDRDGEYLK